ncbi:unnamed protein product, partial [Prorocentrum cordatum]
GYEPKRTFSILPRILFDYHLDASIGMCCRPSVTCSACHAPVHSHCVVRRMSCMVCTSCASEMDFAFANHQAQRRMAVSSAGFGCFMSASGQYAGQAIGAVATGAVGGAARLMTGCASGAVSAIRGMRAVELPSAPATQRPRALEQFDISDEGSGSGVPTEMADVMAEFSRMRAEMEALREENARLRGGSAASARGGYATPSSPERLEEEIAEAQDEGIDTVYGADWSQDSAPLLMLGSRLQDIQKVVILRAAVFLEALGYLEEAPGVLQEVSHMVVAELEFMELVEAFREDSQDLRASEVFREALEVDTSAEEAGRADQVDLVAVDSAPRPGSREMVSMAGQAALADSGLRALEVAASGLVDQAAEAADHLHRRDSTLETVLSKLKSNELPSMSWPKGGSTGQKAAAFEGWLQRISLELGGLHHLIQENWQRVVAVVSEAHRSYLAHGPLDRPGIRPSQPEDWVASEAEAINYRSCELRLRSILLNLMPDGVRSQRLSTKMTSTCDILFGAFVEAGPGAAADKDYVLNAASKGKAVDQAHAYEELQRWKLNATRLATLGAAAPDPSVRLTTLKTIVGRMIESDQEVKHRYCGFLAVRGLSGGVCAQAQVDELRRHLSAEAREFAGSSGGGGRSEQQEAARVAALAPQGGKDPKGKGKDKGKDKDKSGKPKGAGRGGPKGGHPPLGGGAGDGPGWGSGVKGELKLRPHFEGDRRCRHGSGGACRDRHRKLQPQEGKRFNCGPPQHRSDARERPRPPAKTVAAPGAAASLASTASPAAPGTAPSKSDAASMEQVAAQAARAEVSAQLLTLMGMGAGVPQAPSGQAAPVDFWAGVEPSAKTIRVSAKIAGVNGERMLLADTGATHELRGVRDPSAIRGSNVRLQTASGEVDAKMVADVVYVEGESLQGLFPLATYMEQPGLRMSWDAEQCVVMLAGGREVHLHRVNSALYISEGDAEVLRQHEEAGHVVFDPACSKRRGAFGRMRQHFRHDASTRPGGQLSVDLSGPHLPGRWPSGRPEDQGKKAIHFLLAAFSVTTDDELALKRRREEGARASSEAAPGAQGASVGEDADAAAAVTQVPPLLMETAPTAHPALRRLMARAAEAFGVSARPAAVEAQGAPGEGKTVGPDVPGESSGDILAPPILVEGPGQEAEADDGHAAAPKSRTWYYVVPLESRRPDVCIAALNAIIASIRREFEGADVVYRIHGDRASEVTGAQVRHYFAERHIAVTSTPGYEPNANPRAERGVGLIKQCARAMLLAFPSMADRQALWPRAVTHAAWCSRMAADGRRTGCPAFGARVTSRVKDVPRSMFRARAVESIFLGIDEGGGGWLVGRVDPEATMPERRTRAEASATRSAGLQVQMLRCHDDVNAQVAPIGSRGGDDDDSDDEDSVPPEFRDIIRDSGTSPVSIRVLNEAFGSEKEEWRQALENELNSMTENEVFSRLTPAEVRQARPRDIMPMKVVAGVKAAEPSDPTGYRRKKCRGVVCGIFEQHGEGEQVYTSNLEVCSLRSALAVASAMRWDIGAMDVSTAFLNAHLPIEHKEVLVRPPAVMVQYGLVRPGEVWRAAKAIYGLRVSPRAWATKRDSDMKDVIVEDAQGRQLRLRQSTADGAVWSILDSAGSVCGYVLTYVDDFLILGVVRYLSIDIEVKIDSTITLSQHSYTEELLEKWGMEKANGAGSINLDKESFHDFAGAANVDEEEPALSDVRLAQRMAGGLLRLASRTCPDIAYAVSRVAALATSHPVQSLLFGKKVLRYLAGTRRVGLEYHVPEEFGMDEPLQLETYADASFEDIGALTGVSVHLLGCLVDWRSVRQQVVPFSTAEAEVNAFAVGENMSAAAATTLESMGLRVRPTLYGDSVAANHVAEGRGSWRTRALPTKVNAIRSRMARGLLELHFVGTDDQRADGLTKCGGVQHAA